MLRLTITLPDGTKVTSCDDEDAYTHSEITQFRAGVAQFVNGDNKFMEIKTDDGKWTYISGEMLAKCVIEFETDQGLVEDEPEEITSQEDAEVLVKRSNVVVPDMGLLPIEGEADSKIFTFPR